MTFDSPVLFCWAASGAGIGLGHVVRTGALAEAWQEAGGRAVLCTAGPVPGLETLLDVDDHISTGNGPTNASAAAGWAKVAKQRGAVWVTVDDRRVGIDAQQAIRNEGLRLLLFDDHGQRSKCDADLVLDQNVGATAFDRGAGDERAGLRYALLRRRVRQAPLHAPSRSTGAGVVVLVGGSPSPQTSSFASEVCTQLARAGTKVDLVSGGVDIDADRDVVVHRFISDPTVLLASASVALSTAGSTAWELCRVGMPAVLVAVADDQMPVGTELAARSAAIFLGRLDDATATRAVDSISRLISDPVRREMLSLQSRRLVDGLGAPRIVARMQSESIELRPATIDDAHLLFGWANDPDVRAMSFNREQIPWADHVDWLDARLRLPNPALFIASFAGSDPIGQVRFDERIDAEFEIGLSLDRRYRGRHLSAPLIVAGCRRMFGTGGAREILARVRTENAASVKAFVAADFDSIEAQTSDDDVLRFRLDATRWKLSQRVS